MSIEQVNQRIESIKEKKIRNIAKFQLLTACRISEAVGKYAIKKDDMAFTEYKGSKLVLFKLKTAKRDGVERIIALPLQSKWIPELVEYFQKTKRKIVFDYSPRSVERHFSEAFKGLTYSIERYSPQKKVNVARHENQISTHGLRHLRLSELINHYGFDDIDLSIYAGWKMKGMASRYVTGQWGRYVDKLLVKA